jgi:hypothetical protein
MNREAMIRASCLAADLRAYLDGFAKCDQTDIEQWHKDLDDALTGLERELSKSELGS